MRRGDGPTRPDIAVGVTADSGLGPAIGLTDGRSYVLPRGLARGPDVRLPDVQGWAEPDG